jgi:predicted GIY-YIG superfamily endonuclease
MLRIDWGKYPKLGDWDVEVEFYNAARGPRKKLGLVGLLVGDAQRAKAGGCMKYVYILHSISVPGRYYTGMTADLRTRLAKHNAGAVPHTSKFKPWQLKTYLAFSDEKRGLAFEKYLKSASGRAFAKKQL